MRPLPEVVNLLYFCGQKICFETSTSLSPKLLNLARDTVLEKYGLVIFHKLFGARAHEVFLLNENMESFKSGRSWFSPVQERSLELRMATSG